MGCQASVELPPPPASIAAAKQAAQRVYWRCFAHNSRWKKALKRYKDLILGIEKRPPRSSSCHEQLWVAS